MLTFRLFLFLFQVRVVLNWHVLRPMFIAAVSIRNKILVFFYFFNCHYTSYVVHAISHLKALNFFTDMC